MHAQRIAHRIAHRNVPRDTVREEEDPAHYLYRTRGWANRWKADGTKKREEISALSFTLFFFIRT